MSREAGDFADVRGDVAFLNGIYTAYVEEILYPALKQDPMISLGVDIFSTYYDEEIRADQALSAQVKKYLQLGHFEKDGTFTPLPSKDDFSFPLEEEMRHVSQDESGDEIMTEELTRFLADCADLGKLPEAVKQFVMRTHWFLSHFSGLYHAGTEFVEQMRESIHFQMLPAGALFLVFESEVMMFTVGYDD